MYEKFKDRSATNITKEKWREAPYNPALVT